MSHIDPPEADKHFSELPDPVKIAFWGYKFTVEYIHGASTSELNESFERLNRNVLKLNKQELRHAMYSGEFITCVTQLADDPFWHDMGQSTTSRIRRMLDIEYVSEIFLVVMHGIKDGREHLDDYYAEYDDDILDLERNRRKYEVCKTLIAELDIYEGRYRNLADQYSLWSAMSKLYDEHSDSLEIDIERTRENLLQFAPKVKEDTEDELGKAYTLAVLQASNSIKSRQTRESILKGLIVVK